MGRQRDVEPDAHTHATFGDANGYTATADGYPYLHDHANQDVDTDEHTDTDGHADGHTHWHRNTTSDANADVHAHDDGDGNTNVSILLDLPAAHPEVGTRHAVSLLTPLFQPFHLRQIPQFADGLLKPGPVGAAHSHGQGAERLAQVTAYGRGRSQRLHHLG